MFARSKSSDEVVKIPSWDGAMVRGPRRNNAIFETHQRASDQRVIGLIERFDAMHPVDRPLLQVVLQIAADTGPVGDGGDAKFAEPLGRPHAGKLEDLGRTDRAGRQDNLAFRTHLDRASMLPKSDTYGTLAIEQHLLDQNPVSRRRLARCSTGFRKPRADDQRKPRF